MRDVKISKVMNGFTVGVGCQTLVFESRDGLIAALDAYLRNPEEVEKQFTAKYGYANVEPTPDMAMQGGCSANTAVPTPVGAPPGYGQGYAPAELRNW